mgnify:CR=1 FL=1
MSGEERFLGVKTTIEPPAAEPEQVQEAWDVEVVDQKIQKNQTMKANCKIMAARFRRELTN